MRARRALSGAGDRPSSRRSVPQRDGGYLSRSYSDVARASVASSRRSFRASPFGMCSSPVPALLPRCFSRHGDLTKCRWDPGFLLRLLLHSCWGVHPPLSLWRRAITSADSSGVVAPRQRQGLFLSFVRGQHDFRRVPCFALRATAAAASTPSPQKVAVVSASSSTCWLEFFGRRSFFSAPPATAVHRLLNLRVDVGLEPVGPAPQVLLPLVRLHIGLLASCQFHPAEASSHWLTLPRGGLGF